MGRPKKENSITSALLAASGQEPILPETDKLVEPQVEELTHEAHATVQTADRKYQVVTIRFNPETGDVGKVEIEEFEEVHMAVYKMKLASTNAKNHNPTYKGSK